MPVGRGLGAYHRAVPAFRSTPFTVPVHELMHRPGEQRELDLAIDAPEHLGAAVARVPAGARLDVHVRLEGLHEGILATGEVATVADGECVRCLDPVRIPVEVDFQELFAYTPDEAFDFAVRDDHVDLEPVVRDAVVLALPFQPVCRPDCRGLDPETGERLADHPDRRPREVIDPRWAALEGFRADSDT